MKLYWFPVAPNPTKVMVYVREKGIELEQIQINLAKGEQKSPEHMARNPRGALPVLELERGECITESLPIMEFLEELHPEPLMIGNDPMERLRTRALERQVDMTILGPMGRLVHATNSPLGLPPVPEIAANSLEQLPRAMALIDQQLKDREFLAGPQVTIADCTLFAALYFGEFFGVNETGGYHELDRWYQDFKQRPSAQLL